MISVRVEIVMEKIHGENRMSSSVLRYGELNNLSAIELAVRAAGLQLKTCVIRLQDGKEAYEEDSIYDELFPYLNVFPAFNKASNIEENIAGVRASVELGRQALACGKYDLVILDEVYAVLSAGLISAEDILDISNVAYCGKESLICMKSSAFMILQNALLK